MPVAQPKSSPAASTQLYLNIAEIHDNVLVLKDGSLRVVLRTSAVNIDLKSEDERNTTIFAYQEFLNSLDFPVQIVVRSRKLNIGVYLSKLKAKAEEYSDGLMKDQLYEYIGFIQKLIELSDIMQKDFYVVVPFDPPRAQKSNIFEKFLGMLSPVDSVTQYRQRLKEFKDLQKLLEQRVLTVKSGLEHCGLQVNQLNTSELIDLFYQVYNPITAHQQKVNKVSEMNILSPSKEGAAEQALAN